MNEVIEEDKLYLLLPGDFPYIHLERRSKKVSDEKDLKRHLSKRVNMRRHLVTDFGNLICVRR